MTAPDTLQNNRISQKANEPAKQPKIKKKFCGKGRKILTSPFSFAIITNCVDSAHEGWSARIGKRKIAETYY